MPTDVNALIDALNSTNLNGEVMNIIRTELHKQQLNYTPEVSLIQDLTSDISKYRDAFAERLNDARDTISTGTKDVLLLLQKGVGKNLEDKERLEDYLNDSFMTLRKSTGGRYVDELLAPVMKEGLNNYALESLVKSGLGFLKAKGTDLTNATENSLMKSFEAVEGLATGAGQTLLNQLKEKLPTAALSFIKANPEYDFSDVNIDFVSQFNNSEQTLKDTFTSLGGDLQKLVAYEQLFTGTHGLITTIRDSIEARAIQIGQLEDVIAGMIRDKDYAELAAKQLEHAQQVAINLFHTGFLGDFVKRGVGILRDKDAYIANAQNLFKDLPDAFQTFSSGFTTIAETPSLSAITSFAGTAIGVIDTVESDISALHIKLGVGITKVLKYATAAVGIATALAPPNPIGLIGALGSLGGLFGGGGASLEEQMFQQMREGFEAVQDQLASVQKEIGEVGDMIQQSYKNLMQSLSIISDKIDEIKQQLALVLDMVHFNTYYEYNLVDTMVGYKDKHPYVGDLDYLYYWHVSRNTNATALKSLDEFVSNTINFNYVIRQDFTNTADVFLKYFKDTVALYKSAIPNIRGTASEKNLLLIPPQNYTTQTLKEGRQLLSGFTQSYDFTETTLNYFNPEFLSNLAVQYCILMPFYILAREGDPTYKPVRTLEELNNPEALLQMANNLQNVRDNLQSILLQINKGLAQQSLLAGVGSILHLIINALEKPTTEYYPQVIKALSSNELLGKNVAMFWINKTIGTGKLQQFGDAMRSIDTDTPAKRATLKSLLTLNETDKEALSFKYDNAANPDGTPMLYMSYTQGGDTVNMLVPDFEIIRTGQMIYGRGMHSLLAAKEKVLTSLTDITFFQNLSDKPGLLNQYKQVFFSSTIKKS